MDYRRPGRDGALDGIRAFSVLAVMAFHLGALPGGFLGVEIFFVLSGYLITGILIRQFDGLGRISLRQFYARRVARLLPLLVVVLLATALGAWFTSHLERGLLGHAFMTLAYVANLHEGGTQSFGPLGHVWSLSIEEQFYLLWPVAVTVMLGWRGRSGGSSRVLWAAIALSFASSLYRILTVVASEDWFAAIYYGTLSRGSGILMGAALAAWLSATPSPNLARLQRLCWPCVIALVTSFVVVQQTWTWTYTVLLPLVDMATVTLLLLLTSSGGLLRAVLELRVLQYLGRISYGLYLWQPPGHLARSQCHRLQPGQDVGPACAPLRIGGFDL